MSLKKVNYSSLRLTQHLVASGYFIPVPLIVVDVGASGGFEPYWDVYNAQIKLIGFEADATECQRLNQRFKDSNKKIYAIALHSNKGKKPFYVTALACSSGFYHPDMNFLRRIPDEVNLTVVKTIEMDTVDFDSFAKIQNIRYVDFMKLDTEGCELDILKGANNFLNSLLGLSIEASFLKLHKDQPVFSEIDSFLNQLGFRLFDLEVYRHPRKTLPPARSSSIPGPCGQGQVLWGQVLYLRDGAAEITQENSRKEWSDVRILKLASLMELFGLPDCAIELIQISHQTGFLEGINSEELIDKLVPASGRKPLSYKLYMERLKKREQYLRARRKLFKKILPPYLQQKIYGFLSQMENRLSNLIHE